MSQVALAPAPRTGRPAGGHTLLTLALLLPSLLLLAVFLLLPLLRGIQLSLYSWDGVAPTMQRVGLDNYLRVWGDQAFLAALGRTVVWWALHLTLAVGGGLLVAALIAEVRWRAAQTLFRSLAFVPHVLSLAVIGVIWAQLYHPTLGLLNGALDALGLGALSAAWLGSPTTALPAVAVASAWQAAGFYLVIFLASIQGIDPQQYEAAQLDGAGAWQRFRHVTVPGLRNTITLVLVLAFINALKGFGTIWAMTEGGPDRSTELVAVYAYRQAFSVGDIGTASAAGLSIAALALVVTVTFNRIRDRGADQ